MSPRRNAPPGKRKGTKKVFTPAEYRRLRQAVANSRRSPTLRVRDLALISVHLHTALRASDVLRLTWGHVSAANGEIYHGWTIVQQKTKQKVHVVLPLEARADLEAWHDVQTHWNLRALPDRSWPVFSTSRASANSTPTPMSYSTYVHLLKGWVTAMDLDPGDYGTHSLRASLPVAYYQSTKDPMGALSMMGHSSIQATAHYMRAHGALAPSDHVRDAFRDGSPITPTAPPSVPVSLDKRLQPPEAAPPPPFAPLPPSEITPETDQRRVYRRWDDRPALPETADLPDNRRSSGRRADDHSYNPDGSIAIEYIIERQILSYVGGPNIQYPYSEPASVHYFRYDCIEALSPHLPDDERRRLRAVAFARYALDFPEPDDPPPAAEPPVLSAAAPALATERVPAPRPLLPTADIADLDPNPDYDPAEYPENHDPDDSDDPA